jgi:serine/threonine protein kinase
MACSISHCLSHASYTCFFGIEQIPLSTFALNTKKLGRGGQGVVFLCKIKSTPPGFTPRFPQLSCGKEYALKTLHFAATTPKHQVVRIVEQYKKEYEIGSQLNHPNIVKYHRVFIGLNDQGQQVGVFLLMDYVPGQDLYRGPPLNQDEIWSVFQQITGVLVHLQSKGVTHGDIKLENLMLCSDRSVVLIDFGSAEVAGQKRALAGTAFYMPPLCHLEKDLWALGIVIAELCRCSVIPIELCDDEEIIEYISQQKPLLLEDLDQYWFSQLVRGYCLNTVCTPSAQQLADRMAKICREYQTEMADGEYLLLGEMIDQIDGEDSLPEQDRVLAPIQLDAAFKAQLCSCGKKGMSNGQRLK